MTDYQTLTDFVISNTDEHLLNFGILRDGTTLRAIAPAPIFDSGNSMFYSDSRRFADTRAEILARRVTGFYSREEQFLKRVHNRGIVRLDRLPDAENYVHGFCRFKYLDPELRRILEKGGAAVSYRVKLRGTKVYLQAVFSIDMFYRETTTLHDGAIGLDFNDGHIDLSETDAVGNLVAVRQYVLKYHGTGAKAENEMRQVVAGIGEYALMRGKSIGREDLSFTKKKSRTTKARTRKGKDYNTMIHTLDYSRFDRCMDGMCARTGIGQVKVNPAYTSRIAKQKYCPDRKLPVHNGAAYVIARRAQGFRDRYRKRAKRTTGAAAGPKKKTA